MGTLSFLGKYMGFLRGGGEIYGLYVVIWGIQLFIYKIWIRKLRIRVVPAHPMVQVWAEYQLDGDPPVRV